MNRRPRASRQRRVVAVIPARGGSRGVPGKNVAIVGGYPLVVRAVRAALAARHVDQVVVSTDDENIASLARDAGADVVDRPPELAGDLVTSESALLHAIEEVELRFLLPVDVVVLVQCTSPFITAADIDAVAEPVVHGGGDCALTVSVTHGFLWRADGRGVNHDPGWRARRQDRPDDLLETGAAYAMTVDGLRTHRHRFFGRIVPVRVDPARTLEIDDLHDLDRARRLCALLDDAAHLHPLGSDIDTVALDFDGTQAVDGTQTDNRVLIDQDGRDPVSLHRGDAEPVAALPRAGSHIVRLAGRGGRRT